MTWKKRSPFIKMGPDCQQKELSERNLKMGPLPCLINRRGQNLHFGREKVFRKSLDFKNRLTFQIAFAFWTALFKETKNPLPWAWITRMLSKLLCPKSMVSNLKNQLIDIIQNDGWMIEILKTVRNLDLKDCWIGAGFVRNKIWDHKHGKQRTELNDIDIIYFDKRKSAKEDDLLIENELQKMAPAMNWSVKNQARMNERNGHNLYVDCNDAISFWPETATSVAVRLNSKEQIECLAPHGLEDLFNLIVRPTPTFDLTIYNDRIEKKDWKGKWKKLKIKTGQHRP